MGIRPRPYSPHPPPGFSLLVSFARWPVPPKYGGGPAGKPEILALNKIDALDAESIEEASAALEAVAGVKPRLVSGVSGEGVTELLQDTARLIENRRDEARKAAEEPEPWTP